MIFSPRALLALFALSTALAAHASAGCSSAQPCHDESGCASGTGGAGTGGAGGSGGSGAAATFPCKGEMCKVGEQECDVQQDDVMMDVGTCLPLPDECKQTTISPEPKDCSCQKNLAEGCTCQQVTGNFVIFCPPPMM